MSIGKPETEHDAGTHPVKNNKKRRCMTHCKRFWWMYLIIAVALIVLVVCLIIFVAVPKIAQSKIDDAKLEIQSVSILDSESESYTMDIDSTITTDGSIHANIDGFTGNMYLEDVEGHKPFATLDFPETNGDKHQLVNVTQRVKITDMDAFKAFNIEFVQKETVRITVEGKTKVQPSGLNRKYGVTFKKTLEVKALNMFAGTRITEGKIDTEGDEEGNNFHGKSIIPNASHFTLDIGNVSFTNFVGDKELGTLYINDLLLQPGDNHVDVRAKMDQAAILTLIQSPAYCETGIIPFKLLGKEVVNHDQELSYFAAGLASGNQTVPIDIGGIIESSLGIKIGCKKGDKKDKQ